MGFGFEALASLCRGEEESARALDAAIRDESVEEISRDLRQIGLREWETSVRGLTREGLSGRPRKHAWDEGDFEVHAIQTGIKKKDGKTQRRSKDEDKLT